MVKKVKEEIKEVKPNKAKELVAELESLYLHHDSELGGCGLYYRVLPNAHVLFGSIDKNTVMINRIKAVILELKEVI